MKTFPFLSAVSMASDLGRLTVLAGNLWLYRWQVRGRRTDGTLAGAEAEAPIP